MRAFAAALSHDLAALAAMGRQRALVPLTGPSRTAAETPSGALVSFCSNDYLGLASHPALAAAAADAGQTHGTGAGASRLVSGDLAPHRDLERALALFLSRPSALVFPTGYQTNLGVITALAGRDDLVVSDALNHASIIDGCRLSRATVAVYPHADAAAAARALARPGAFRRRLLVTESLFSMDGDTPPLAALAAAAGDADAILIVDEAHALGVMGPGGRGLCAAAGVTPDVLVGTLGKAFGAAGGFAAGVPELRDYLLNHARSFIYTTALPPPVAASATAAVPLAAGPEGDARRSRLMQRRAQLLAALTETSLVPRETPTPPGPILPLILGEDARAVAAADHLRRAGFLVPAIRPPTVPAGSARLRITLSADHTEAQVAALARALRGLPS